MTEREIKKPFGINVSPDDSPIQPERFSSYHTGLDFEVFDLEREADESVTVTAFCGGKLIQKKQAAGYGGVVVQECMIENAIVTVVYGHVRLSSVVAEVNSYIPAGNAIGMLGAHESSETDGERRHLHFGIHRGNSIDIRGYVQSPAELKQWADPTQYLSKLAEKAN